MAGYDVVWPRSRQAVEVRPLAPRPATLDGARVAFLWDDLFRGDEIFPVVAEELQARFEGVDIVGYEVFGSTHGDEEARVVAELAARLAALEVDAVVSGMGC